MASHGVFLVMNAYVATGALKKYLNKKIAIVFLKSMAILVAVSFLALVTYLTVTGKTNWGGRSLSLLDPTYASKYIPIIASVSEHQPSTWANYVMDLHILPFLSPIGLMLCFYWATDASLMLGVYGIVAVYFSGMMIRLLLVLSAAASCLAGVAASTLLSSMITKLRTKATWDPSSFRTEGTHRVSKLVAIGGVLLLFSWCYTYVCHCTFMSSMAYSSPSIVMSGKKQDGTKLIQDDFREAYYWLRQNTHQKATVASWWDYGYQITSLANRTVIVDNNTWNNTHIATIGLMLGSQEKDAYDILDRLDVDYVLVLSGGVARYSSDDIAKFLWPVRIAQGVYPDKIKESDFIGQYGYTVDESANEHFKNSVIYKLCYYRMGEVTNGMDYARNQRIGVQDIQLSYFEEAFTTENWIVRIYKVKDKANRSPTVSGQNGVFKQPRRLK